MKKRLILLLAAMLTVSAVALTGCGSNPTVTTANLTKKKPPLPVLWQMFLLALHCRPTVLLPL